MPKHQTELLSLAIWKWTERDGKWQTRYRSGAALALGADWGKYVNHEHVITRLELRKQMLSAPDRVSGILRSSVACIVTRDEHVRLSKVGDDTSGWADT